MLIHHEGNHQLGADAVGTGNQDGLLVALGQLDQTAEAS
ncbi:hypothetical protein SDC9_137094 [bioreactor metagenome]|uniref:Uncharacterized protein n=1 Tax=bioreactor metagenome TaxID=1076179 RepID=A0A645DLM5_9ZZZZ